MSEDYYELPKYKNEKIYYPYRCPYCYKILRIKIFAKEYIIKYNCQCKNEWFISFIPKELLNKPKQFDDFFKLKCYNCHIVPSKNYKYLNKCNICKKIVCQKEKCQLSHLHEFLNEKKVLNLQNLNVLDVTCNNHSKDFIAYCKICDKDLCMLCLLQEKKNHNIIFYKDILPKKEEFLKKYDDLNNFSAIYVSLFKDVRLKTNLELIYFYHFREIIRTIFFNFSRFSKYNKYNFALISNFLENSDFVTEKISYDNKSPTPTDFFKTSNYFFDFLESKNKEKINFFIKYNKSSVSYIYLSSPMKKYFIIGDNSGEIQLYNSKTFSMLKSEKYSSEIDHYIFKDNKLIFTINSQPQTIIIYNIDPEKKEVKVRELIYKENYNNICYIKDYLIFNNKNDITIFDDKGNYELKNRITLEPVNQTITKLFGLGKFIIYEKKFTKYSKPSYYEILSYNIKNNNKDSLLKSKKGFKEIIKLDDKYILLQQHNEYIESDLQFNLFDVYNKQIISIFNFKKENEIKILDNKYFIVCNNKKHKKINLETKFQNIFNSKFKIIYNYLFPCNSSKDNLERTKQNELILLPRGLLCYRHSGLIFWNTFTSK